MYYSAVPSNGNPAAINQEKQANIYVPAQSPFGPAPAGYAQGQPGLPPGLAAAPRYAAGPQAYAVATSLAHPGYGTAISPAAYTSLPYAGFATIPTSSHAYISPGQYPGVGYQPAALAQRTAGPPSHYSTPVQAGAPLIAAGYAPVPGTAMPAQAARNYAYGFPAAYSMPTAGAANPGAFHHPPAPYEPPY